VRGRRSKAINERFIDAIQSKRFSDSSSSQERIVADNNKSEHRSKATNAQEVELNWDKRCYVCGQFGILDLTDMCPVCTFGEADAYEDFL
jgi:hypothetical protein